MASNLIEYSPHYFEALHKAASHIRENYSLRHQPFVDYYYASRPWCKLYLFFSPTGHVTGMVGVERMAFEFDSQPLTLGFGSNFHALQRGVGGILFTRWIRSCDWALEYGGTEDAHRIIRQQGWRYFPGIRFYALNHDYPVHPGDGAHRRAAKWVLRQTTRKKIPAFASRMAQVIPGTVSVKEEFDYSQNLLPSKSPFLFRLVPTVDYLSWRYNTRLSFVTYRLFRILTRGRSSGYVIINDSQDRLLVAQCDGEDPETLAYGVLLSVLEAGRQDAVPRTVLLACANPAMAEIYTKLGLKRGKRDYPMAIGGAGGKVGIPADTAKWLVNFDWGDNGLLGPFRGQEIES